MRHHNETYLSGDSPCQDCGSKDNIHWTTKNVFWNHVNPEDNPILCVYCFVGRAEKKFDVESWTLTPEFEWKEKTAVREQSESAGNITVQEAIEIAHANGEKSKAEWDEYNKSDVTPPQSLRSVPKQIKPMIDLDKFERVAKEVQEAKRRESDWRVEFDDRFVSYPGDADGYEGWNDTTDPGRIRDFISQALKLQREGIETEISSLLNQDFPKFSQKEHMGYMMALNDILNLLSLKEKE